MISPLCLINDSHFKILGTIRVFEIQKKQQIGEKHFSSSGRCLIWLPQEVGIYEPSILKLLQFFYEKNILFFKVDPKGKTFIAGFADGVVRTLQITTDAVNANQEKFKEIMNVELIQVLKPHTKPILSMDVHPKGEFFATSVCKVLC